MGKNCFFLGQSHEEDLQLSGLLIFSRIAIPSSVEEIRQWGFHECASLNNLICPSSNHINKIDSCPECGLLCQIEISLSVMTLWSVDFSGYTSLNQVIFGWDNHIKEIEGLQRYISLCRIDMVSSIEVIGLNCHHSFCGCTGLNKVILLSNNQVKEIRDFEECSRVGFTVLQPGCLVGDTKGLGEMRRLIGLENKMI
jgi:hypothetical protein